MENKKIWLKISMLQDRFSNINISIMYIEKYVSTNISSNDILNVFLDENRNISL